MGAALSKSAFGHASQHRSAFLAVLAGLGIGAAVALRPSCLKSLPFIRSRPPHVAYSRHCPKQYVARRGTVPVIDGDPSKAVWTREPWSEAFGEIRGKDAPVGAEPSSGQSTRVKMLWDDQYLYVLAVMDLTQGQELIAKFTERNSPIFHTDVDFEVFIDAPGCCHGYKELELNAINTVWNLMLNRPYMDGGTEYSGRVAKEGETLHWDVKLQKTATRILEGALHDPSRPSSWCCELAFAHAETLQHLPESAAGASPSVGDFWRINFSRVEGNGNENWVWSPQVVWEPQTRRYEGKVNMHLPDAYGYVIFADAQGRTPSVASAAPRWRGGRDPSWPARSGAMCIYYAARFFKETNQRYPRTVTDLKGLLDEELFGDEEVVVKLDAERPGDAYEAHVLACGWVAIVNQERLLRVHKL